MSIYSSISGKLQCSPLFWCEICIAFGSPSLGVWTHLTWTSYTGVNHKSSKACLSGQIYLFLWLPSNYLNIALVCRLASYTKFMILRTIVFGVYKPTCSYSYWGLQTNLWTNLSVWSILGTQWAFIIPCIGSWMHWRPCHKLDGPLADFFSTM